MQKIINVKSDEEAVKLFGNLDANLNFAEKTYGVEIISRAHQVVLRGEISSVEKAELFFLETLKKIRRGEDVSQIKLQAEIQERWEVNEAKASALENDSAVYVTYKGKPIIAKSNLQCQYVELANKNDIVFSIGPAGTGKTYLAVAIALQFLREGRVQRLVLTRPAVEAGESLGFLPGDMNAKINPYLRPLYDSLYEMLGFEEVGKYLEKGIIEIVPLAYMRGRTLNDSFIILDEAQNSTSQQMKMFLTRLGFSSKCIITGDVTQIDLPSRVKSGLVEIPNILKNINGIDFVYFSEKDVVRHKLVKEIIKAYEKEEKRRKKTKKKV